MARQPERVSKDVVSKVTQSLVPCSVFAVPLPAAFLVVSTDYYCLPVAVVLPSSCIDYQEIHFIKTLIKLDILLTRTAFQLAIPSVRIPETGFATIRNNPNKQPQTVRFQSKDCAAAGDDVLKTGNPKMRQRFLNITVAVGTKPTKLP